MNFIQCFQIIWSFIIFLFTIIFFINVLYTFFLCFYFHVFCLQFFSFTFYLDFSSVFVIRFKIFINKARSIKHNKSKMFHATFTWLAITLKSSKAIWQPTLLTISKRISKSKNPKRLNLIKLFKKLFRYIISCYII